MKRLILGTLVGLAAAAVVVAQSPEEIAERYGVTFPISELGNCGSFGECRSYCEDPVHRKECVDFAKRKGFYHEVETKRDVFWQKTKSSLGCDSEGSCRAVCENPQNFDKCSAFAQDQDLGGGYEADLAKSEILQEAREVLGCASPTQCMEFCGRPENQHRCSEFASKVGLRGGQQQVGPGGCTSAQTCQAFCTDPANYQICSQYAKSTEATYSGPGGCNSEESCRQYCEQHSSECGYSGPAEGPKYDPAEMCQKTPSCSWVNDVCQCGGGQPSGQPQVDHDSYPTSTPGTSSGYDPAAECAKSSGCSWNGSSCQCSSTDSGSGGSGTSGGGDMATECSKYPGCSWTGSSCQCGSVQGWQVDSGGRLVHGGQVLGDEDGGGSSGSSGSGSSGSGSSGSGSGSSGSGSDETRTVESTSEIEVRSREGKDETKTEVRLGEGERIRTRIKDGETRTDVWWGGMKVRIEQKDGRLIIKAEKEGGEEEEVGEDEVFEIEERLDRQRIKVATGSGEAALVFARGNTAAQTALPLSVDLETNSLIVTTPAGVRTVAVLPDQAVANLLAANVIDRLGAQAIAEVAKVGSLTGVGGVVSLGEKAGVPVYEIAGVSDQRFLLFVPVAIKKTIVVSAETGEVVQRRMGWGQRMLDWLSF